MFFYDSHSHQASIDSSILIPNMEKAGIRAIVCISPAEEAKQLTIMRERGLVLVFKGVHPSNPTQSIEISGEDGIGEIGLDRTYNTDIITQKRTFDFQLNMAEKRGEPVSIHSRGATDLVLSTLNSYRLSGVLLHWFDGPELHLKQAIQRGYFISVGPTIIYDKKLRANLQAYEHGLLLFETDSPVFYSKLNLLANQLAIASVYFAAANYLKVDLNELLEEEAKTFYSYIGDRHKLR